MYNIDSYQKTRSQIEKLFVMMTDKLNADSDEFTSAVQKTIYEMPDEKSKYEVGIVSEYLNLDNMEEFFCALIKCGAVHSFRSVMDKIDDNNRSKIIDKLGDKMIHLAMRFKHLELVKELVKHGCDVNKFNEGVVNSYYREPIDRYSYHGLLGYAIDVMLDDMRFDDAARKSKYDELAVFFKTSHVMSDYQLPPYQSGGHDKAARFYEETLRYLLAAGADPDARGIANDFVGTPVRLRKEAVAQARAELPTLREHCSTFKRKIEESETYDDMKNKLGNMLDIVINAPAIQQQAAPTCKM